MIAMSWIILSLSYNKTIFEKKNRIDGGKRQHKVFVFLWNKNKIRIALLVGIG